MTLGAALAAAAALGCEGDEGGGSGGSGGGATTTGTTTTSTTTSTETTTTSACAPFEEACDGACTDVITDPQHCGACGRDCLGAACADSRCAPTELAAGRPRDLAVTADALYWSDVQVWRLPLAGGEAAPLFQEALDPGALAVDATHAYFTEDTQGAVMRVALDGSAAPEVVALAERPMDVAVDATHLYWTQAGPPGDQPDGALMRAPLDGSAAPELLAPGVEPDGLTLGMAGVIWADGGAGAVLLTPKAGGATTPLAADQPQPNHVATDDVHAYWTDPLEGHVAKAPLSGGPVSLVSQAHTGAAGITYREEILYWVADQDNALIRIQVDSTQMREMIRFDGELTNITAVDASYVYYATTYPDGSGAVKRVPR